IDRPRGRVVRTAEKLEEKGSTSQVRDNKEIIDKVQTDEFWDEADIFDYEIVRKALRDLIRLIDRKDTKIYYTDFKDEIVSAKEGKGIYTANDLSNYRRRVEHYLKKYDNDLPIYKLKNNKKLSDEDIRYFEKILWHDLGTKEDYQREYGDEPLLKMVSSII